MVNLSIDDFVDGSGLIECPDCGEVVETAVSYTHLTLPTNREV